MLTGNVILFVIACFILTVDGSNSNLRKRETPEIPFRRSFSFSNKSDCWEHGGVPVETCQTCPQPDKRDGLVKLYKNANGELVAYNFGYPIKSRTNPDTPMSFSDEVKEALEDGGNVQMQMLHDHEEWRVVNDSKLSWNCSFAVDYNCLQSVILRSESDFKRFKQLGCKQLSGDLIITNFKFYPSENYTSLMLLEKIWGRLVIDSSYGNVDLDFRSLTRISRDIQSVDPVLQITNNKLKSIHFPKLEKVQTQQQTSCRSIVFGENIEFSDEQSAMPIYWRDKTLNSTFPVRMDTTKRGAQRITLVEVREVWMDEGFLVKAKIHYKPVNWYRVFFTGGRLLPLFVSIVLGFICVVTGSPMCCACARKQDDPLSPPTGESDANNDNSENSDSEVSSTR